MSRIIFPTLLSIFLFSTIAQAKIVYNSRTMQDIHLNTIKGYLYEVYEKTNVIVKKTTGVQFARTIQWLNNAQKSKKIYTISPKSEDLSALLVLSAMKQITQIINDYEEFGEALLRKWHKVGKKVQSSYKEKEGKITWKLVLQPPTKIKIKEDKNENNKK